jgi:hypothetical protein
VTARSDIKRIVSVRLVPIVSDLEEAVHRNGYLRVLSTSIGLLGTVGLVGQILGITWLRYVFATLAAVLFILASSVAFAATETLRRKSESRVKMMHSYADALVATVPVSISEWRQDVVIDQNGDAKITRLMTLEAATGTVPRHLSMNLIYYGQSELTLRAKRRVVVRAHYSDADGSNESVRVVFTSAWNATAAGVPKLDIYAHLGPVIHDGDVIKVVWTWPKYSADLMSGRQSEDWDVVFRKQVRHFEHSTKFRGMATVSSFSIKDLGGLKCVSERVDDDLKVTFKASDPPLDTRFGFVADYKKRG